MTQSPKTGSQNAGTIRRVWANRGFLFIAGFIGTGFVTALAAWMASEVFEGETMAFDLAVRDTVHGFSTPLLTRLMIAASVVGSPLVLSILGAVILGIFLYLGWKRECLIFLIVMSGEVLLDLTLKGFYARARPEPFFDYLLPSSFSFPSGHALGSLCFFGSLAWLVTARMKVRPGAWAIRIAAGLLILLIGVSRIYLGVHYPTDIGAGYLTGLVWLTVVLLCDKVYQGWN